MAQTVEEIAEILNEIRVENAHNMKGFDKVLTGIDGVLEKIAEGGQSAEMMTDYLNDLRSIIEEKHGFEARKLSELELSLKNLLARQDTLIKTEEMKELFAALSSNYNNFSSEVYGQREVIVNIDKKLVDMASDDSDKSQIINSVLAVRQELGDINKAREIAIEDITGNLAEILKRIIMLDVSDQNDIIKRELENIYVTSNAILSSLQIADQRNDTLAKMIEDTVTKENYEQSQTKIKDILDKTSFISEKLQSINITGEVADISEHVSDMGEVIFSLKEIIVMNAEEGASLLNEKVNLLEESFEKVVTEENFADFRKELGDFVQTIIDNSNNLNNNLSEYKPEFENILNAVRETDPKESIESLHSKFDGLNDTVAASATANVEAVRNLVNNLEDEIKKSQEEHSQHQLATMEFKIGDCVAAVKNASTETDVKLGNSLSEISELKNDIARFLDIVNSATIRQEGRFDVINDNVGTNLEDAKDSLNNILIRLENLKTNFSETSQNNKETLMDCIEDARSKTESLIGSLDASSSMGLETIRTEIGSVMETLEEVKSEFRGVSGENVGKILSNMDDLSENISNSFADKFNNINERFEWVSNALTDQISSLKEVVSDYTTDNGISDKIYTLNGLIENTAEDYDNKLCNLKNDIEEFAGTIERINSETDVKLGNSVSEISNIKTELVNVMDILNSASYEENQKLDEISGMISADFADILAKITFMQDLVQSGLKGDFQNIITELDDKFENLLSFFEVFKKVYTGEVKDSIVDVSDKVEGINEHVSDVGNAVNEVNDNVNSVSEKLNEVGDKISSIKDEIALVNTDLMEVVNSKADMIYNEFEPLKSSINGLLEFDFSDVLVDVREQIQNVYSNISADLSSNGTLNHVSLSNLEETSREVLSRFNSLEESVNGTLRTNLELLHSAVEGINRSVEETIGNQSYSSPDWAQNIKNIEEKIVALGTNYEKSLNLVVKDIRQTLNTVVNAYSEDMRNSLAGLVNNEATIFAVDNLKQELSEKIDSFIDEYRLSQTSETVEEDPRETIQVVSDGLKLFVEDTFQKHLSKINDTIKEVNAMGTLVDDNDEVVGIIDHLRESVSSEISTRLDKFVSSQSRINNETNDKLETVFAAFDEKLEQVKHEVNTFIYDHVVQQEKSQILNEIIELRKNSFGFAHILKPNLKNALSKLEEKVAAIDSKTPSNEYFTKVLENHKSELLLELGKISDELGASSRVTDSLESLHQKIDLIVELDDMKTEPINEISEAVVSIDEKTDMIEGISEGVYFLNEKADKISGISDAVYFLNEKVQEIPDMTKTLSLLHDKVDVLAMHSVDSDEFDLKEEIQNVKDLITNQIGYENTQINNSLRELLSNITDIENDLEKNAKGVKNSIIDSIVVMIDQINFEEESGQIKDFVEIKTEEINQNLQDVKNTLQQITNPEAEYTYSLQDIESDISKLRLMLNGIQESASSDTFNEITTNINRIVSSVNQLETALTTEQISEIKNDFSRLSEDVVSISARTNQLLLTSDESYKILTNSLEGFGKIVNNLEEKVSYFDNTEISQRIEKKLDSVNSYVQASVSSDKVLREAMIYVGEWIDNTSENIGSITEKTAEIDGIKSTLIELKAGMPDNNVLIEKLEQQFEEQQARIDRLEKNLDRLITVIEDKDDDARLFKKVDKIEKQLSKLGTNLEKLTSYVDEE